MSVADILKPTRRWDELRPQPSGSGLRDDLRFDRVLAGATSDPLRSTVTERPPTSPSRTVGSAQNRQRLNDLRWVLGRLDGVTAEEAWRLLGAKNREQVATWLHGQAAVPRARWERAKELARILRALDQVLERRAVGRWLREPDPQLRDSSPIELISAGKFAAVLALIESYADPSYS